ncbi:TetR/AcrR family transcriptional regulator [Corynebacterium mendelii]|uniref:TetR family transcriptional regulator n=1 Tax=Corynebacterium mendelii TaxID=2765362 RepID=A0A939E0P1_9CORY|nr:TetR/AcrR family transcriptional regulator [Corynebacterium mendelii]MBN9644800.1 TetR family transcriptional regulator [Corynebacterium mendelii]
MSSASLREHKRRATKTAIQDCATALVMDKGIDAVTVDDICAAAGISRRTFFNYVDSKESAILGDAPRELTDEEIESFAGQIHPDLPRAVVRLIGMTAGFTSDGAGDDCPVDCPAQVAILLRRRKIIMQSSPAIFAQRFSAKFQSMTSVTRAVSAYLGAWPDQRLLADTVEQEAQAVVFLTGSAIQMGVHDWMKAADCSPQSLADSITAALDRLRTLSERSATA